MFITAAWMSPSVSSATAKTATHTLERLIKTATGSTATMKNSDRPNIERLLSAEVKKILLLAYARSCQHMGESETAINAAPRAVSELRKSNFIPRELSSFLKESVKTAHFNLIAASL